MADEDGAIVRSAINGDRDALATLLERHAGAIHAAVHGRIPMRWQAVLSVEDLFQEACTRAFLGIGGLRASNEGGFLRWIVTLANHAMIDALKALCAGKRGGLVSPADAAADSSVALLIDEISSRGTSPSLRASRKEVVASVTKAVAELPETYQTVVRRYDLGGEPMDAVARDLGKSLGATFMLRSRALDRLRDALKQGGAGVSAG